MVTLRPARPDEAERVAEVWHDAWHDGHDGRVPEVLLPERDPAYFLARSRELIDATTVAQREDGAVLGVVIVRDDELQQLMVTADARGTGVGGLLIAEAERQVAARGHAEIWLAVVPGNDTARRFYAGRGWVDRGVEDYPARTLAGTVVPSPVHRYVKALTGS